MNFAGALVALYSGHKVKRKYWTGYWQGIKYKDKDKPGIIVMHTYDGKDIPLTDTDDIFYTLSHTLADDWEIIEDWDKKTTQPDYFDDNRVKIKEIPIPTPIPTDPRPKEPWYKVQPGDFPKGVDITCDQSVDRCQAKGRFVKDDCVDRTHSTYSTDQCVDNTQNHGYHIGDFIKDDSRTIS